MKWKRNEEKMHHEEKRELEIISCNPVQWREIETRRDLTDNRL